MNTDPLQLIYLQSIFVIVFSLKGSFTLLSFKNINIINFREYYNKCMKYLIEFRVF